MNTSLIWFLPIPELTLYLNATPIIGHVGCPLPCCKVKLVDVPEMGYYAKDNKGEVCCLIYYKINYYCLTLHRS